MAGNYKNISYLKANTKPPQFLYKDKNVSKRLSFSLLINSYYSSLSLMQVLSNTCIHMLHFCIYPYVYVYVLVLALQESNLFEDHDEFLYIRIPQNQSYKPNQHRPIRLQLCPNIAWLPHLDDTGHLGGPENRRPFGPRYRPFGPECGFPDPTGLWEMGSFSGHQPRCALWPIEGVGEPKPSVFRPARWSKTPGRSISREPHRIRVGPDF